MKKQAIPTKLEGLPLDQLSDFKQLWKREKVELVRFNNAIIGGSWWALRRETKHSLCENIQNWAKRQIESNGHKKI